MKDKMLTINYHFTITNSLKTIITLKDNLAFLTKLNNSIGDHIVKHYWHCLADFWLDKHLDKLNIE